MLYRHISWDSFSNLSSCMFSPHVQEGDFQVKPVPSLMKTYEDMVTNIESRTYQVGDSRTKEGFDGSPDGEIVRFFSLGHFPGIYFQ